MDRRRLWLDLENTEYIRETLGFPGCQIALRVDRDVIADDGTVVNIADMKPQSLDSHCSTKPVRYVLEMNQGWFAKRGIGPGYRLSGAGGKPFGS